MWPFKKQTSAPKNSPAAQITSWGDLPKEDYARHGLEAFMGMVTTVHYQCGHFWCDPAFSEIPLLLKIDFYLASTPAEPRSTYIGAYLWEVKEWNDDQFPTFGEKPLQKLIIQPVTDGRVSIIKGTIDYTATEGSAYDQGLIDQTTSERLGVSPCSVPNIPEDPSGFEPAFICERFDHKWGLMRLIGDSENTGWVGYQPFGTVKENPTMVMFLKRNI